MSISNYAMIPARFGSQRLKLKNLALIDSKPLIYYAIEAAKQAGCFNKIIINSDHKIFKKIADKYGVDFYLRKKSLGKSLVRSDHVVRDFIIQFPEADIVSWVNPIAPFQTADELKKINKHFKNKKLDSLITVKKIYTHCDINDKPINYKKSELFARTQDLMPVNSFVYTTMMWNSKKFIMEFKKKGNAFFCGKFGTYEVNNFSSIIIKNKFDLLMADSLMRKLKLNPKVSYDKTLAK